jgi:hypothetical protein
MDITRNHVENPIPLGRRLVDQGGPDFYPTPAWATHALLDMEGFTGPIWEPACGDGAMSRVLIARGQEVTSTDLFDRAYGTPGVDFLKEDRRTVNIVTNPPYVLAEHFVHAALRQASGKVAMLLRLAFLEGGARQRTLFGPYPPARVHIFSERLSFYPAGVEPTGRGATPYAWFVWDQANAGPTELRWISPGTKARHTPKAEAPLPLFG